MRRFSVTINSHIVVSNLKKFQLHMKDMEGCDHAYLCALDGISISVDKKVVVGPVYSPAFTIDHRAGQLVLTVYLYKQAKLISLVLQRSSPYASIDVFKAFKEDDDED